MLQIYFGNGKGKTSAAVGCAVRAAGHNLKILFVQFFKNSSSGEVKILKEQKNITYMNAAGDYKLFEKQDNERNAQLSSSCNNALKTIIKMSTDYDMIVLDEVCDALSNNYIDQNLFLSFLCNNKDKIEIIITGHIISQELSDLADYLSEIKSLKHPYMEGKNARTGIEF